MAALTRYVNTASTAGGDGTTNNTTGATRAYPTLLAAITPLNNVTLTDSYTFFCDGSGGPDTSDLFQTPWSMTTSAANYILVTAVGAQRARMPFDTSRYYIARTNANGIYNNLPGHLRIDGIQVQITINDGLSYVGIKTTNANQTQADIDCRISNCIVKGIVSGVGSSLIGFHTRPPAVGGGGTSRVWNDIALNCTTGFNNDFNVGEFYNDTAANCSFGFVSDASMKVVNCLGTNPAGIAFVVTGVWAAGSNFNAADDSDTDIPGASSSSTRTFTFVNAAGGDYHLASTDAGAKGLGMTDPGSGLFSDDFDGQTRVAPWDIGADQIVSELSLMAGRAMLVAP